MAIRARDQRADAVAPPRALSFRHLARREAIPLVLIVILTLIGGLMRRYHLGQQSLWFDEADLIIRARAPLPELLRNFVHPGENGPLYTLGLAIWMKILGTSEIAVRLPSAIAGTLAIPALYGLGRTLKGSRFGLIAAALLTISPYAHWYAQDAKMYSLLVLLTVVSTWLLVIAIQRGGSVWIAYAVVAAVTLGVHATFLLALVAHIVIAVTLWRRGYGVRPTRRQLRWLGVIVGVALLPLIFWGLLFIAGQVPTWQVRATPWAILHRMLIEFTVTHRADGTTQIWGIALFSTLVALGVGLTWIAPTYGALDPSPVNGRGEIRWRVPLSRSAGEGLGAPYVGAPRIVFFIIGSITVIPGVLFILLSLRSAVFEDRYLIVALPGFVLLAALGLDGLLRWRLTWPIVLVGGIALLLVAWMPLRDVNFSTVPQKEDWREVYRHLAEHARDGDGVVIYPGYLRTTYEYYALEFPQLRALPVITPPSLAPDADVSDRALVAYFQNNTRGWQRAWLVESPERAPTQDPDGRIRAFYESGVPSQNQLPQTLFEDRKYNGVRLMNYAYDGPYLTDHLPPNVTTVVSFGDTGIALFGASFQTLDGSRSVARGTFAPLLLRWVLSQGKPTMDYIVLVRLVDGRGKEVGRYDIPPLDGHWPTSTWGQKDEPYDPHDLFIPPDLAPGNYTILVGLAPMNDPTHPAPVYKREGTRVDTDGLYPVMTITVT